MAKTNGFTLPPMTGVNSSRIMEIGYNDNTAELFVRFVRGALYVYLSVPKDIAMRVTEAESVGSMLEALVVKGGFNYRKLEG